MFEFFKETVMTLIFQDFPPGIFWSPQRDRVYWSCCRVILHGTMGQITVSMQVMSPKLLFIVKFLSSKLCKYHYRPKRSFGQGNIFTRVCDSVHRGGTPDFALIFRGGAPDFALIFRGGLFWGGLLGGAPDFALIFRGVFFWGGSSKFSGGGSFFGGVPPNFRGGCSPPEYGQRSAGTHPTGMHSCCLYFLKPLSIIKCKNGSYKSALSLYCLHLSQ